VREHRRIYTQTGWHGLGHARIFVVGWAKGESSKEVKIALRIYPGRSSLYEGENGRLLE
jgi:hypothetical protein